VIDSNYLVPYGQSTPYNNEDSPSLRKLGGGAFGEVYYFKDETNRCMAIKVCTRHDYYCFFCHIGMFLADACAQR